MGKFNMGGDFGDRNNRPNRKSSTERTETSSESADADAGESRDGPPDGFDFSGFGFSGMSFDFGSFSGAPGQSSSQTKTALILCGVSLAVILIPIILLFVLKRRH